MAVSRSSTALMRSPNLVSPHLLEALHDNKRTLFDRVDFFSLAGLVGSLKSNVSRLGQASFTAIVAASTVSFFDILYV
jgi:hypothetical protein